MADLQPPEDLRPILREAIEQACPSEDQCLADEAACFAAHPIHEFVSSEGRLEAVYANVDGLVDVVLGALAGRLLPPGGEVSTQWMIRNADGVEGEHTDDERAIRQSWAQGITWWDPDGSYELCRCTFTVWPDGTEYIGPWEVVERHPVVPDDSENNKEESDGHHD